MKIYFILLAIFITTNIYPKSKDINKALLIMDYAKTILSYGTRVPGDQGSLKTRNFIKEKIKGSKLELLSKIFSVKTPKGRKKIENIWAVKEPVFKNSKTLVIATHYDSKYFKDPSQVFYGADDGVSGTAILLALIKDLKNVQLQHLKVVLLFLDGEEAYEKWSDEDSLYGSRAQVTFWKKNKTLAQINELVLLDMVGGKNPQFCREKHSDKVLSNKIFSLAKELKIPYFNPKCSKSILDDHIPFFKESVNVIDIIPSPFPNYWHKFTDTYDKLSPETMNSILFLMTNYIRQEDSKISQI